MVRHEVRKLLPPGGERFGGADRCVLFVQAAEALGAISSPSSISILKKYLDDPERCVRETCEIALAKIEWDNSEEGKKSLQSTTDAAEQCVVRSRVPFAAVCSYGPFQSIHLDRPRTSKLRTLRRAGRSQRRLTRERREAQSHPPRHLPLPLPAVPRDVRTPEYRHTRRSRCTRRRLRRRQRALQARDRVRVRPAPLHTLRPCTPRSASRLAGV